MQSIWSGFFLLFLLTETCKTLLHNKKETRNHAKKSLTIDEVDSPNYHDMAIAKSVFDAQESEENERVQGDLKLGEEINKITSLNTYFGPKFSLDEGSFMKDGAIRSSIPNGKKRNINRKFGKSLESIGFELDQDIRDKKTNLSFKKKRRFETKGRIKSKQRNKRKKISQTHVKYANIGPYIAEYYYGKAPSKSENGKKKTSISIGNKHHIKHKRHKHFKKHSIHHKHFNKHLKKSDTKPEVQYSNEDGTGNEDDFESYRNAENDENNHDIKELGGNNENDETTHDIKELRGNNENDENKSALNVIEQESLNRNNQYDGERENREGIDPDNQDDADTKDERFEERDNKSRKYEDDDTESRKYGDGYSDNRDSKEEEGDKVEDSPEDAKDRESKDDDDRYKDRESKDDRYKDEEDDEDREEDENKELHDNGLVFNQETGALNEDLYKENPHFNDNEDDDFVAKEMKNSGLEKKTSVTGAKRYIMVDEGKHEPKTENGKYWIEEISE